MRFNRIFCCLLVAIHLMAELAGAQSSANSSNFQAPSQSKSTPFQPTEKSNIDQRPSITENQLRANWPPTTTENKALPIAPPESGFTPKYNFSPANPNGSSPAAKHQTTPKKFERKFSTDQSTNNLLPALTNPQLPPDQRSLPAAQTAPTIDFSPKLLSRIDATQTPENKNATPPEPTTKTGPVDRIPASHQKLPPSRFGDTQPIRPVTFAEPISAKEKRLTQPPKTAKQILQLFDVSSSNRALPGMPVSLEQLMDQTPLKYRKAMVVQYWEAYFDWATLRNYQLYADWLAGLSTPTTQQERMMLATAQSIATDDVLAAEIQLAKSQAKLKQLTTETEQDLLPLPIDQPLVSNYKTHYQWYAERNLLPKKLIGINEVLPRIQKLITDRASTINQAEIAMQQSKQAYANSAVPLANVLASGKAWQSTLQSFAGTVVDYNHAICDYALTITSPQKPIGEVAAMLVGKPVPINRVADRNSILQGRQNRNGFSSTQSRSGQLGGQAFGQPTQFPNRIERDNSTIARQDQSFSTRVPANNSIDNQPLSRSQSQQISSQEFSASGTSRPAPPPRNQPRQTDDNTFQFNRQ